MTTMIHRAECVDRQAAHEAFEAKYPNYCRKCGGEGLDRWWESHGEPMVDFCPGCTSDLKCPRCAGPIQFGEEENGEFYRTEDGPYFRCVACGATSLPGSEHKELAVYVECDCEILREVLDDRAG